MNAREAAALLKGDVVGRDSILAPGPGHSPKDRSLSVKLTSSGIIVHSFAGDDWRSCQDHVLAALGIEHSRRNPTLRIVPKEHAPPSERALQIWREAGTAAGTLAERYLERRKLVLPGTDALRFHPRCPFGSDRLPCLVALYRDIITDEPKAIHRTALTADGQKIDRKALGPKRGCAIKLTPDEDVTYGLAIAEGIETALAGMQLHWRPAWALGDANEIKRFPVLPGLETLTILVDNDAAGRDAALECSQRWTTAGKEVFRVIPTTPRADIADVVNERAA